MNAVKTNPARAPIEVQPPVKDDARQPQSEELGEDVQRLERQQRVVEERRRTEELARLRALQRYD